MTEQLSTLLHDRASGMDFDAVDLDLLVTTGDRRVRRRRFAGAAVGVAAVAAVSGLVVAVGPPSGEKAAPDATDLPRLAPEPSYALGTTIHTPSGEVQVGHQVTAYVRTRVGYVTTDPEGRVWSVLGGEVEQLGQVDSRDTELIPDVDSSAVGWVDPSGDSPVFVIADQATGTQQTLDVDTSGMGVLDDEQDPASFYALSNGVAYLRTHDGAVAIDVDTGEQRVVDEGATNGFDILGAYDGTVAFAYEDFAGIALGPVKGDTPTLVDATGDYLAFAPGGTHFLVNNDDLAVFETGTGDRVDFRLKAEYSGGFDWLDDDTLVALTVDEGPGDGEDPAVFTLLTCRVSTATCEPAALDVPNLDAAEGTGFSFPGGIDYRD